MSGVSSARLRVLLGDTRYRLSAVFDGAVVPAQPGVYLRLAPAGPYSCWDGQAWHRDASSPAEAAAATGPSAVAAAPWQGLADPVDAVCATCGGAGLMDRGTLPETGEDLIEACPDC